MIERKNEIVQKERSKKNVQETERSNKEGEKNRIKARYIFF